MTREDPAMPMSWILLALLVRLPAAGPSPDLDQAGIYFDESQAPGLSDAERLAWLERSLAAHPTYRAHYEAGKLRRGTGDLQGARHSFEAAFEATDEDRYLAQAAYQVGITWFGLDRFVEAREWLRKSLAFEDNAKVRDALREVELSRKGEVLSAAEILTELQVTRAFKVAKAELRVNFELNEDRLDPTGRLQAEQLGLALSDPGAPAGTVVLFGHTDLQCPRSSPDGAGCDHFNDELSSRRAGAVRDYLIQAFGLHGEEIWTVGCGRQHPLSRRDSSDDHYLNRRVVVMVTSTADEVAEHCANTEPWV